MSVAKYSLWSSLPEADGSVGGGGCVVAPDDSDDVGLVTTLTFGLFRTPPVDDTDDGLVGGSCCSALFVVGLEE